MHPMERAFLDDIIAHPADDTPRLVYADWLDDEGRSERAEFIRVQVEVAGYARSKHGVIVCEGKGPPAQAGSRKRCKCRPCDLVRRDRELLFRWGTKVIPEGVNVIMAPTWHKFARTDAGVEFSRGFVRRAFFPLAAWEQHGPALVAAHPVERVEMTDKRPRLPQPNTAPDAARIGWFGDKQGDPCDLPLEIWRLLARAHIAGTLWKEYAAEADALDDLSLAALAWAKAEAAARRAAVPDASDFPPP